jgi:hypothetical protein
MNLGSRYGVGRYDVLRGRLGTAGNPFRPRATNRTRCPLPPMVPTSSQEAAELVAWESEVD